MTVSKCNRLLTYYESILYNFSYQSHLFMVFEQKIKNFEKLNFCLFFTKYISHPSNIS